jgi:hypothetical protein
MSSDGEDYQVGYGKPPKHSRFKPGQSGNPAGRKAGSRKRAADLGPAPLHPTNKALARRADRLVAIIEDGERQLVPTRDALFGALTVTALKGGVLAQRTLIQLMQDEDDREHSRRRETFDYWRSHVIAARGKMKAAQARGAPVPDILPHPDDVLLDYQTLTVRIIGPLDEEEAAGYARMRRGAFLCLELSLHHGEDNHFEPADLGQSRIGFWLAHHLDFMQKLPPRMRALTAEENAGQMARIGLSRKRWEAYLRAECEALDIPFMPYKRPGRAWAIGDLLSDKQLRAFRASGEPNW